MPSGVYLTMQAMKLKLEELDNLAHNLANVNTDGFKEENVNFESVLTNAEGGDGQKENTAVAFKSINFAQGPIVTTGDEMNVALQGPGFFEVQTETGNFYTRDGVFGINASGELVDTKGGKVMGESGSIVPGNGRIEISPSGVVMVDGEEKGKIKMVEFGDLGQVKSVGSSRFKASDQASPQVAKHSELLQGKVEQSNTSTVGNLVKLVEVTRQYETYQKILSQQSKMDEESANSLGRLT
ncbi:flagellar hook basal-body protein [bacterium]|nr:flagellar hook basal-body protein [bacterium]